MAFDSLTIALEGCRALSAVFRVRIQEKGFPQRAGARNELVVSGLQLSVQLK